MNMLCGLLNSVLLAVSFSGNVALAVILMLYISDDRKGGKK